MEIKVSIRTRSGESYANGIVKEDKFVVLSGGKISKDFAACIRGGRKARSYRGNREFVDENRNIIKDCEFASPSTAAQFVTGRSSNGYEVWKVEKNKSLGKYLEELGLR